MSKWRRCIPQIAGAITSSLFGYLGASLAGSLGASIATAIGLAGLPAFAVAAAFAVTGSIIAGYLAEAFTENHWGDWMNTLIESVPGWLENLDSLFNPGPIDPLVIDLDNDGIDLTDLNTSNAYFDLDGDGFRERTGWVAPDDGLLAVDINGNGKIDDISELFGSPTASGFAKLTAFDTNGNGVVNDQDSQFADLRIWQDLNGNGETDSGELRTLTEAGVASISLNASDVNYQVNGNQVVKTATVTMTSDVVTQAAEVLFAMSQAQSSYVMPAGFTYDTDVFKMPMLRGFGDMPDLWVSMSQNDQLKVDAHALIDQAKAGNFGNFADNFDDLLADWAGVADVVWMQDAPELSAAFAFDETEYAEWLVRENDGIAGANPLPTIRGYVFRSGSAFTPDAEYDAQVAAWLATNGYVAPGFDGDISTSGGPQLAVSINGGFTQQTLPFRIVPGTIGGADPTPAPAMDAAEFAFLQTLMGRSFTQATNFIAPENLLVANVTPQQVAALQASYDEVKHYMEARFLAQAAYTIIAEEGENADLGALAPFTNITFNPFTDELGGNVENFVTDLVNEFRTGTLGTDADALHILDIFGDEIGPLGGYVAENFLDIDRALIATVLGTQPSSMKAAALRSLQPWQLLGSRLDTVEMIRSLEALAPMLCLGALATTH